MQSGNRPHARPPLARSERAHCAAVEIQRNAADGFLGGDEVETARQEILRVATGCLRGGVGGNGILRGAQGAGLAR